MHLLEIGHTHGKKEENVSRGQDSMDGTPGEVLEQVFSCPLFLLSVCGKQILLAAYCDFVLKRVSYKHRRRQTTGIKRLQN